MNKLRELAPWQIIGIAAAALVVCAIAGYFVVTMLTTAPKSGDTTSSLPSNLDQVAKTDLVDQLNKLEKPANLSPELLRTPSPVDPDRPSTVNPFE